MLPCALITPGAMQTDSSGIGESCDSHITQLTCNNSLNSILQVLGDYCLASLSSCVKGCLVANVSNVCPTVARGEGSQAL